MLNPLHMVWFTKPSANSIRETAQKYYITKQTEPRSLSVFQFFARSIVLTNSCVMVVGTIDTIGTKEWSISVSR